MIYQDKYHLTPEQSLFLAKKLLDSIIYCGMKMENRAVTFPQTKTILNGVNVPGVQLDDSKGFGITVPSVGDKYTLGSAVIEILGVNRTTDANNCSIILMITYGETKFLFTGDAERDAEQTVLNSGADPSATVLKVGHHGSEDSTTYPFLREIMPKYAVISVGDDNSYGHPRENTLSRLRDVDVKVFRTDMQGDIYCTSDGKTITMSVEKNADADTLTNPVKVRKQSLLKLRNMFFEF